MQATIDDRRVAYDARGKGMPLLLMHAFPLTRAMYDEQAAGLEEVARVVTFDAPGVGRSESAPLTMNSLADTAAKLLDALNIERAAVGGVSMGGYAALAFARRHPHRLSGLLLADTRAAADSDAAKQARAELAEIARSEGPAAIAERMLPKVLGETARKRNKKLVERVRGMIESVPGEVIAQLLEAMAGRDDSTDLLAEIAVPALVVVGENDALTPPEETRGWAGRIPGARIVEIAGAGHLANLEAPEEFNRAAREFWGASSEGGREADRAVE